MKAQDLYTLGLRHPDSFKLAGVEFVIHDTNPSYAFTKGNKTMLWIGSLKDKVNESHLIWNMEVTDIVKIKKEKVIIEFEIRSPDEIICQGDLLFSTNNTIIVADTTIGRKVSDTVFKVLTPIQGSLQYK